MAATKGGEASPNPRLANTRFCGHLVLITARPLLVHFPATLAFVFSGFGFAVRTTSALRKGGWVLSRLEPWG